jgi:hypothetical protein
LDRTILFAANSNLGLDAEKLLKLDVEDFNSPGNKIILIYSPKGLKKQIIQFAVRTISLSVSEDSKVSVGEATIISDIKRNENEDWYEFFARGFCTASKKAKIIKDCKVH